jgi:uncharacterized protein
MQYRSFGKLDWDVSVLSFGAMRLPLIENSQGEVDEAEAIKMMRHSIDKGVNYVDTAYVYHGGKSEVVVGKALQDGYRDKVKIATKLWPGALKKTEDMDTVLNEQLERLQTDTIDFYLLHGLNQTSWPKLKELDVLNWAEGAQKDGRIKHLGFSFHDTLDTFKEIVDDYDKWVFCQIQLNYMDVEFQAGLEGLKYASDRGLAVIVMEPLRGGLLSKEPPKSVAAHWEKAPTERPLADWALQWVWDYPEVATVLSGMTTMQHVEENLISADIAKAGSLSGEELAVIDKVREEYKKLIPIDCTYCKYCMPCSENVNIARIFELYNTVKTYGGDPTRAQFMYQGFLAGQTGDLCTECYECEEACPQEIAIVEWLKEAHELLGPNK